MQKLVYLLLLISTQTYSQFQYTLGMGSSVTSESKGIPIYGHLLMRLGTSEFLQFGFEAHTFQSVIKDENNDTQEFRSLLITMPYTISFAEALDLEKDNLDPYLGLSFGILHGINDTSNAAPRSGLKFFGFGGIRYYFQEEWGLGAEFSYGYVRSLKLGICLRY